MARDSIKTILLLIVLALTMGPFLAQAKNITIEMTDDSYKPADITINTGDAVIFQNAGDSDRWPASNIHPTHEIYPEFDPRRPITPNKGWLFIFDKAGVWKYHDHLDPRITGTITVLAKGSEVEIKSSGPSGFIQRLLSPFKYILEKIMSYFKKRGVAILKDSKEIFNDETALKNYIQEYGPKETTKQLNVLSSEFGSCHDQAHRAGRVSYELLGDEAFKECGSECHSGCYHGATEAYFKDRGTKDLAKNLNTLCGNELNGFFSHQCIHGIGHGLMAWASYEINDALESCDLLSQRRDSCWTGVFMENIVGGLTKKEAGENGDHFTKYLSDNPQYPCDIVDEKYKSSCYFLQTSRMVQLFSSDYSKVATACLKSPGAYQYSCFSSMGRDVGGSNRQDPDGAIKDCGYAPKGNLRDACLAGAIQDTFWDPTGQDDAINFCKKLTDQKEKSLCYDTIFGRAKDVLISKKEITNFCSKTEDAFREQCLKLI